MPASQRYDVVVVGGGHNGLVAAAYLAKAGHRVLVLERRDGVGGAAVSARPFPGVTALSSRYSYLVSLLPDRIVADLGARVVLADRPVSAYAPDPDTAGRTGLLVDADGAVAPGGADAAGFAEFHRRWHSVTAALWPTLLEPLTTAADARRRIIAGADRDAGAAFDALRSEPIGTLIGRAVGSDLLRGLLATDALIGTFARTDDPTLVQNACFLYHVIGGGTGAWRVPVGGMGAISDALARAALRHGADVRTNAAVHAIDGGDGAVHYRHAGREHAVHARWILANVTPSALAGLLGDEAPESAPGSQIKVNLVVTRLPRLRDATVTPERAFGGTFHVNETLTQLDAAYDRAVGAVVPDPLPCEVYCHSLTDPTVLSEDLRRSGAHTLTAFGLHTPHWLNMADPAQVRRRLTDAVLTSLDSVLAEPIRDVVMTDADGAPCIEAKTTADLEDELGMTSGHIFHGALRWPFTTDEPLDTPAQRWGVATRHDRVLLCGSGSRRGGAVSGIGGHNAAMAVLDGERP